MVISYIKLKNVFLLLHTSIRLCQGNKVLCHLSVCVHICLSVVIISLVCVDEFAPSVLLFENRCTVHTIQDVLRSKVMITAWAKYGENVIFMTFWVRGGVRTRDCNGNKWQR